MNPSRLDPGRREKIKAFIKPFGLPQRSMKMKIKLIFIFNTNFEKHGAGRVKLRGQSYEDNILDKVWIIHKHWDLPQVKRLLLSAVKRHSIRVALWAAERLKILGNIRKMSKLGWDRA